MARFLRGQTEGKDVELLFKAVASNKRSAKVNVAVSYFGRRPGQITALKDIEATTLNSGFAKEYTVKVTLDPNGDLKHILKGDEAAGRIADIL